MQLLLNNIQNQRKTYTFRNYLLQKYKINLINRLAIAIAQYKKYIKIDFLCLSKKKKKQKNC